MSKPIDTSRIDGECELCGYPGIIDMTCSECGGRIISLTEETAEQSVSGGDNDRYDPAEVATVSLEDLAEEEDKEDETTDF